MFALASAILVSVITIAVLTRMGLIQGIGVQHFDQTSTATQDRIKELGEQLSNLTRYLHK